ncbi:hypothetical protein Dsin_021555 [Dipteronia sinensis]|uniref:RNase H type-1 domain-containing protein n=1 Tax=Dipteronia sinensis TaxID=43782 RepID=A0AAE0A0D7_9ROSI|nr:hypothetical protein Dsin_021555 [Dipteronia sinensis]
MVGDALSPDLYSILFDLPNVWPLFPSLSWLTGRFVALLNQLGVFAKVTRSPPYLFLLCTEGLSSMLYDSVERGELTGLKCGLTRPVVSHLFFADDSLLFTKATAVECGLIRRIIEDYSKASGQLVNFGKSAVCMSKTFSSGEGKQLADIIGVHRDRMWERVKGWRRRLLSIGGKEVLITSVLQSIPAYIMNLFRLPKGLVTDLHRLCSRFWWGSTETSKKMHWASWRRLCRNKSAGGLGFRDLSIFNQALLAKQGWRLVKYPNSLVARVLRGVYFPTSSFLKADCKQRCSLIWSSLCWGKGLLECDAAIKVPDNCVGVGIVIRNHCGLIMGSSAQRIEANFSSQIAEAVAILRGIVFAKDMGLLPAVVESDALGVVNLINTGSSISADVGVVLSDILNIISTGGIELVQYVPRMANMVAHSIARMALSISQDCFWVEECPPSVGSLVLRVLPS